MKTKSLLKILIVGCVYVSMLSCNSNSSKPAQTGPADGQEAMSNWESQKFSMFIHWGLYSIPAGVWENQQINGYSEQIKGHAKK